MEWFVIYNNEHLGPFSESVLHQLYEQGDLTDETFVWQEGMSDPVTYQELFILNKEQLQFRSLNEMTQQEEEDDDVPPPLPPEVLLSNEKKQQEKPEEEEPEEVLEEVVGQAQELDRELKKGKGLFYIAFFLLIMILVPVAIYFKSFYLSFSRPAMMSLDDFERLEETTRNPSFKNHFAVALGQQREILWLATNNPYEGEVVLKLKSVKEKTLTHADIEATARGYLKGKIVEFSHWTFSKGVKLIDGYYHVEAYTTKELNVPLFMNLLPGRKKQFRFFDELLISKLSKTEFDEILQKKQKELTQNDLEFWIELKQKYKTIKMITLQIKTEMDRAFDSDNVIWIEELKNFEMKYKKEFGTFFTNFVIQNDQSYDELKSKNFSNKLEIISNYNRLSLLAKDIGRVSMSVFREMEDFDGIDDARKEVIRKRADDQLDQIIQTCDEKIKIIQTNE